MKFLFLFLPLFSWAVTISPTTFDLRSLSILVASETGKNIIVTDDVKNLSVNYFFQSGIDKETLFDSYVSALDLKGLHVNDYDGYYIVSSKSKKIDPVVFDPRNYVIEVKVFEVNKNDFKEEGFETTFATKGIQRTDFDILLGSISNANALLSTSKTLSFATSLKALSTTQAVNIIQEPFLICTDGKENSWNVGGTIQIKKSDTSSDQSSTSLVRNTYEEKPIGLTISAKPQRLKDKILVDLKVTIESVVSYSSGLAETSRKQMINSFVVNDGESILLSGLLEAQEITDTSGIPLLMDLPLLGYFFSYTEKNKTEKILNVLVTVKVAK